MTALPAPEQDATLVALIERIAVRDARAVRELYDLTAARLFGLARSIVRSPEWAEDVLQDAFLVVWRNAADYRQSLSPPLAWLGLIVRSRALDTLRRRKAERSDVTDSLDNDDDSTGATREALASDAPGPQSLAETSEQAAALHQCLARLQGRQRELITLAYLRDLSHGELAAQLRLPLGTVKTWIRRGLDQLRVCMARYA